jgi:hypothetical protein
MARFNHLLRSAVQSDTLLDPLVQSDIFNAADVFAKDAAEFHEEIFSSLEEAESELVDIHRTLEDAHAPVFIELLYHLSSVLPSRSILASWFDLALKPALRDSNLSFTINDYAQDIVVEALIREGQDDDIVSNFRRRLLEYYLLDTVNAETARDIFEWTELSPVEKDERSRWKQNLEQILLKYGRQQPDVRLF